MFIFLQYVFDRLIFSRARANALRTLRSRLARMEGRSGVSPEESASALRLRELRTALGSRLGAVVACTDCVRPRSEDWPGGNCCGARTTDLFTDDELASLKLSGTTSRHFRSPAPAEARGSDSSGCIFRKPSGCALSPAHRPSLCLRYTCFDLQRELDLREDKEETNRLQTEIDREFSNFTNRRKTRRNEASFEALRASLCDRK